MGILDTRNLSFIDNLLIDNIADSIGILGKFNIFETDATVKGTSEAIQITPLIFLILL